MRSGPVHTSHFYLKRIKFDRNSAAVFLPRVRLVFSKSHNGSCLFTLYPTEMRHRRIQTSNFCMRKFGGSHERKRRTYCCIVSLLLLLLADNFWQNLSPSFLSIDAYEAFHLNKPSYLPSTSAICYI